MLVTRNVWIKYHNPTDGEGNDLGGGSGGAGEGKGGEGAGADDDGKGVTDDKGGEGKGESKPTDAEAKLLKEVMDKKARIKSQDGKISELESKLKQFEGIDPESIRNLLKEKQDEETRKLEEKGQWDSLKKQIVEAHTKELGTVGEKLTAAQSEVQRLQGVIAELTVGNAFASSQFIKEDLTMPVSKTRVLYGSHFEFQDGKVVAFDKPAGSADRTVLVDGKGDPLDFESALKKIVDSDPDRDQILRSKMKTGAGSKSTGKEAPAPKLEAPRGVNSIAQALGKGVLQVKK